MLARSTEIAKAARSVAWTMSAYGLQTVLRFISRIVLAKLLINAVPIGQVVLVTTILTGLEMLTDMGVNVNIVVHKDGDGARFLGTARSVQFLRSLTLFLTTLALAYPVAWVYDDRELAPLIMFAAITVLGGGLGNPRMSVFVRQFDLSRPTIVTMLSEVSGFVVTVVWALRAPSAWALVGGSVASSIVSATASHLAGQRTPFAWDKACAKDIIHFGGWIILSSGTYFLSSRGEVLILKGAVPAVTFGCFAFATMLVSAPLTAITQLASQVMQPFQASWARAGPRTVRLHFGRMRWLFMGLAVCFSWGALLVGPYLIEILNFNESYDGLRWMVQCLGIRAAFDIFVLPTSNSLLAAGATMYLTIGNIVRAIFLVVGLFLAVGVYDLGLPGAMWVLLGAPLIAYMALLRGLHHWVPGALPSEMAGLIVFLICVGGGGALALALHG